MAAMTLFHTEKCCHLVSAHAAYAPQWCIVAALERLCL